MMRKTFHGTDYFPTVENLMEMKLNRVESDGDEIALCFFVVGDAARDSVEKQTIFFFKV